MPKTNSTTPFEELRERFSKNKVNDLGVFSHCLGLTRICLDLSNDQNIANARGIADELAAHTVVICIDTEHYTLNSDEMTEIGVGMLRTTDVLPFVQEGNFGEHGEMMMQQARFHFLRLQEKSHLPTTNVHSRGPEGNRFGRERFVTFDQARTILRQVLVQPIVGAPGLQGYNCPIVVLGHSIAHDRGHLNGKDLALDVDALGTIVRYIDTQQIARNTGNWWNQTDEIGLRNLVSKFEIQHSDSHTACNDVGRTMICAMLLALPKKVRAGCTRTAQQVATALEMHSRKNFVAMGGTPLYCYKCGSTQHKGEHCQATGLRCEECISRGLIQSASTHIDLHCPIVRDEVATERLAWYAGQPKEWMPKHPFSSRDRLQTFAPNAPTVSTATHQEVAARWQWYDNQRGSNEPLKPFVWSKRLFHESPLKNAGPIRPLRGRAPLPNLVPARSSLS